ncbi:putative adhesin [Bacteroides nordii]|uniref:putative adhesin n=1 Tax=Bacteroides nordii TaxID=291645 RepID=UPI00189F2298|nr:hypothetical protein [Bacteroides nordii]
MIVYLIGHGFTLPNFPLIRIPKECDLRFYVPEGELFEEVVKKNSTSTDEEIKEAYDTCTNASLYEGDRTPYYIWNDGEAIRSIDIMPPEAKEKEKVSPVINANGDSQIHEHLLQSVATKDMMSDLENVHCVELGTLGNWDGKEFKILEVKSVTVNLITKEKGRQYVITPLYRAFSGINATVYKLSWLMEKIIDLRQTLMIPDEERIKICWSACRFAMAGTDNSSFLDENEKSERIVAERMGESTTRIDNIFP